MMMMMAMINQSKYSCTDKKDIPPETNTSRFRAVHPMGQ